MNIQVTSSRNIYFLDYVIPRNIYLQIFEMYIYSFFNTYFLFIFFTAYIFFQSIFFKDFLYPNLIKQNINLNKR